MSNPHAPEHGPQPPKVLRTPLEIVGSLRPLQQNHTPLKITFHERNQYFQSYVVDFNRNDSTLFLDEMIPSDGERYLQNGEAFHVEAFHEGVLVAWDCPGNMQIVDYEGERCYVGPLPEQVFYHQRRNAFRAPLRKSAGISVGMAGVHLRIPLQGLLVNISASGCKVHFSGDVVSAFQPGQIYEAFSMPLPDGRLQVAVELRHAYFEERASLTYAGLRFVGMSGHQQRLIDRFVSQLQREARRNGF